MTVVGTRLHLADGAAIDGLEAIPAGVRLVQMRFHPTDEQARRLGELMRDRPEIGLRLYASPAIADLEFLRFFPTLRSFQEDAMWDRLTSLDGLRHLPDDLEELGIGMAKRPLSLAGLARFTRLRALAIEGRHRDLDVIGRLPSLESLTLRSVPLGDLSLLTALDRLTSLDLKLGGIPDVSLLPAVGRLEALEIWQVKGLSDVSSIGAVRTLRTLFVQSLRRVRTLPDLAALGDLRTVTLETMNGIDDLAPLATAPALETLNLIAMGHLAPAALRPLIGHPTLRRGHWNIGSLRKTFEAHDILPIAPEPFGYADWKAGVPYRTIVKAWLAAVRIGLREVDGRMVIDPDRAARAEAGATGRNDGAAG